MKKLLCAIALMMWLPAMAQMPLAKPQASTWAELVEFEFRLRGVPNAAGTVSTARLIKARFATLNATAFTHTEPCWNTASACPVVASATVRIFIKLPWSTRLNVTKYVLCEASECLLPPFAQMQAKVGEGYSFRYNRLTAAWDTPPRVVAVVAAPPATAIAASPASVSFAYTRGGALPPAQTIKVTAPGNWSATDQSLFYDQSVACWAGGGGSCASGASTTLTPSAGMRVLPVGVTSAPLTITSGTLKLAIPVTVTVQ